MKLRLIYTLLIFGSLISFRCSAEVEDPQLIDEYMHYQGSTEESFEEIAFSSEYKMLHAQVVNLGMSDQSQYIKFYAANTHSAQGLFYYLKNPGIGKIELFQLHEATKQVRKVGVDGGYFPYSVRPSKTTGFLFNLQLPRGQASWYLMKVTATQPILITSEIGSELEITRNAGYDDNKIYLYLGLILALIAYNIFLAFSTREVESIFYIAYLCSVGLVQITSSGMGATTFWPNSAWWSQHAIFLFGLLSGVFTMLFVKTFIRTKKYAPVLDKIIIAYIIFSLVSIPLVFLDKLPLVYKIINFNALSSFILLVAGIAALRKGSVTAKYFIVAWVIFLTSVMVFALKDYGILPYNKWTVNAVAIGSSIEGILLSFAIANKINILKRQKEDASAQLIRTVRYQNEMLEIKVQERTEELETAKNEIQSQYDNLRVAQHKLIEAEKMAGLGQMTAGIAHELNNPINFVSSNVAPLHRDIQDVLTMLEDYRALGHAFTEADIKLLNERYEKLGIDFVKKEIEALLNGIEEGSRRTAEIVKGLRVFARSDKDDLVKANLNECLLSTLVVMKSVIKGQVTLTKELDENMPSFYCYPGKLNQVIVNLVTNAIQATNYMGKSPDERKVHIKTYYDDETIYLSVKDNGIGIDEEAMQKIFIPFYTTKPVGEGTGLGLSITMGIVEAHKGHIDVITEHGKGAEFVIHLPRLENKQDTLAA